MSEISKLKFNKDRWNGLLVGMRKPMHKGKIILPAGTEGPQKNWKLVMLTLQ